MVENRKFLSFHFTEERRERLEQIMDMLHIPHDAWGAKSQALDYALRLATQEQEGNGSEPKG